MPNFKQSRYVILFFLSMVSCNKINSRAVNFKMSDPLGCQAYLNTHNERVKSNGHNLVMWGDSLTDGTGSSGGKTPLDYAADKLGKSRLYANEGMGGNLAEAIAARAGALSVNVLVAGNKILGDTNPVEVTPSIRLLDGAGNLYMPVKIAGVLGTLKHQVIPNPTPYTFTRLKKGRAQSVNGNVKLDVLKNRYDGYIHIIWIGTNDLLGYRAIFNIKKVEGSIRIMIDDLTRRSDDFIILTLIPKNKGKLGIDIRNPFYNLAIKSVNKWILKNYKSNVIDVYSILTNYGFRNTPSIIRSDKLHLNDAGYKIVGDAIAEAVACREW